MRPIAWSAHLRQTWRSKRPGGSRPIIAFLATVIAFVAASALPAAAKKCPADSVKVGPACVDTYDVSVWSTIDTSLVKRIQKGKITTALDLIGATQHGIGSDDYGVGCPDDAAGSGPPPCAASPSAAPAR